MNTGKGKGSRKRVESSKKRSADDGDPGPSDKRKRDDIGYTFTPPTFTAGQLIGTIAPPAQPATRGQAFAGAINALSAGGMTSVFTSVDLQLRKSAKGTVYDHTVPATFGVKPQGDYTQGLMTNPNNQTTSYDKVLPTDLGLDRATLESRVIKQLSPYDQGKTYDAHAKITTYSGLEMTKGTDPRPSRKQPVGGIALGTFLEDITASRAVGLKNVGSATRALVMAEKWKHLAGDPNAGQGFQKKIYKDFPQFGKGGQKYNKDWKDTGIAALKEHWDKGGTVFTKQMQLDNITAAHNAAYGAAAKRFDAKFKKLEMDKPADAEHGSWWADNHAKFQKALRNVNSGDEALREKATKKQFPKLFNAYMQRKMTRHGIIPP